MPAIEARRRAEVEQDLAAFFETRFAAPLAAHGIVATAAARELFVLTAIAQAEAGIVALDSLLPALRRIDLNGVADFYLLKFGARPLSYNRMTRLLGDMHDKWVALRQRPA